MADPQKIELDGALRLDELARFHFFHLWRKSWRVGILSVLLVMSAAVALGNRNGETGLSKTRIALCAFLGGWVAVIALIPYRSAKKQWAMYPYLTDSFHEVFTPRTIRRTGPSISSEIAWSVVREIYETKTLFLLYIAPNQAIILPKRFFPDVATLQAWKQLAKAQTPPFIEDNFLARWI